MQRIIHELTLAETKAVIGGAMLPQPVLRPIRRSLGRGKASDV